MLLCQAQGKRTPEGVHGRSALEREEGSERLWGAVGAERSTPRTVNAAQQGWELTSF